MKFETSSVLITWKIDIETYAYVHESVLGIKFALCNPIFGEMPIVALRHNFHIIRTMLSQSSQFTFVIYARTAFTSFKRRLTDKKRKKKKNTVTKKLRKEIHQLLNQFLPLLSKPMILQQSDTSSKQTDKHANYKIFKEGSTFTTFSGHTQRKKKFSPRSSPPQGYQEPSIPLGRRSCRFKAGKSPSTLKPPRNRDISRVVWIVWYLYKAWSIGVG